MTVDAEIQEERTSGGERRRRLPRVGLAREDAGVLVGFVLLTVLLFRRAWASPTTTWVGEPGDPPLFMWFLRWMPYALAEGQNPLFTHHINYPDGVNLMWNTAIPLPALVLSPLTLTAGPIFSYNVLTTVAVSLSGFSAYFMLRRYVTSQAAAVAGGLLYGFSPYVYAHAHEHANLTAAFVPPLMFLVLDEILVRQRRSAVATGLVLGALGFVQLMISEELLATQALIATVGLALLVALHRDRVRAHARHAATALGVALVSSLALAAFPLAFQFLGPGRVRSGSLWSSEYFVSDLLGFVIPTSHLHFSPDWADEITERFTHACCPSEWSTYIGAPLVLFMIAVTARMWSKPLVRFAGLLAAAAAVLSMGPHLHVGGFVTPMTLPFAMVADKPVVGNILAVRLMLYAYLMVAIVVAVAVDSLLRRPPGRPLLAAGLAALLLVPLVPDLDFPATRTTTPPFFRSDAVRQLEKDAVVLVAPYARDTSTSAPMLWQAEADMRYRMPEGYILGPDGAGRFVYLPLPTVLSVTMEEIQRGAPPPALDSPLRAALVADLVHAEVEAVLVGPMGNRDAMIAFFRELLRQEPISVAGVVLWTGVDPATLE